MRLVRFQSENAGNDHFVGSFKMQHSIDVTDKVVPEMRRALEQARGIAHEVHITPQQANCVWHGMIVEIHFEFPNVHAAGLFSEWLFHFCSNPEPTPEPGEQR